VLLELADERERAVLVRLRVGGEARALVLHLARAGEGVDRGPLRDLGAERHQLGLREEVLVPRARVEERAGGSLPVRPPAGEGRAPQELAKILEAHRLHRALRGGG
jgi:hypothetical protein